MKIKQIKLEENNLIQESTRIYWNNLMNRNSFSEWMDENEEIISICLGGTVLGLVIGLITGFIMYL